MWSAWNEGMDALCTLDSRMVELFVDDTYMGLYELMPAIRPEKELERIGGNPATDVVFRVVHPTNTEEKRPSWTLDCGHTVELRYKPESMSTGQAERLIAVYSLLNEEDTLDDEAFAALAEEVVDIRQVMEYYLFFQACALRSDNVSNNLYIWYVLRDGDYRILLSPWDMDYGLPYTEGFVIEPVNTMHVLLRRMLDLDVGGCRAILWSLWEEKKETLLSEESIYAWIRGEEEYINASGAYQREYQRWYGEAYGLDLTHMYENEVEHIGAIEDRLRELWQLEAQEGE